MLVSPALHSVGCIEFEAEVYLLFHTTYICRGFQTVVYVGNVCQTAKIVHMDKVRELEVVSQGYVTTNCDRKPDPFRMTDN